MKLMDFIAELKAERLALERATAELKEVLGLVPAHDESTLTSAPPHPDFTHLECYRLCHLKMASENELTNNRLSWNFTIQGFLFAAYALTLQSVTYLKIKLASTDLALTGKPTLEQAVTTLNSIVQWMPWAGISVSACIGVGALAAQIAIFSTRTKFQEQHPEHRRQKWTTHGSHFPGVIGGGNELAHSLGLVPLLIPWLFIFIWWSMALAHPLN